MKFLLVILVIALVTSSVKLDEYQNSSKIKIETSSTPIAYDLEKKDRIDLEKKSSKGDAQASFRLYLYYLLTLNNIDKQMLYLKKSAYQGYDVAQYSYGYFLSGELPEYSKYYNLNEAIFWLKLAKKNGNNKAKLELETLEKQKTSVIIQKTSKIRD
ncbi:hypothetical protein A6V27_02110 [Hafnia alvei]|uniref:hypothetical protein n=1 Tax=Hafnia alvei TaxID=569 RepID=UPI0007BCCEA5|nr:hypothetical protein [Hafnia alvei]ANC39245.1 hypothetical protein A6V27_02110 [Hafnia alvei]